MISGNKNARHRKRIAHPRVQSSWSKNFVDSFKKSEMRILVRSTHTDRRPR